MVLEMRCGGYICVLMSTKVLFLFFSKFFLYTWEDKYCVKNFPLKKKKKKKICNDFNGILVGASLMTLLTVTVVPYT